MSDDLLTRERARGHFIRIIRELIEEHQLAGEEKEVRYLERILASFMKHGEPEAPLATVETPGRWLQ